MDTHISRLKMMKKCDILNKNFGARMFHTHGIKIKNSLKTVHMSPIVYNVKINRQFHKDPRPWMFGTSLLFLVILIFFPIIVEADDNFKIKMIVYVLPWILFLIFILSKL